MIVTSTATPPPHVFPLHIFPLWPTSPMPWTQSLLDWCWGLEMMQPQNSEGGDYIKSIWKPTRRLSCSPLFEFKGSHLGDERAVHCPPSPLIFIACGQTSGWSPWRECAHAVAQAGAVLGSRSRASQLRSGTRLHSWARRWAGWSWLRTCFLTLLEARNRVVSHGGKTVWVKKKSSSFISTGRCSLKFPGINISYIARPWRYITQKYSTIATSKSNCH